MKFVSTLMLTLAICVYANADEEYQCQTGDGLLIADLTLGEKIDSFPRQAETCNGSMGDPDWECHTDDFIDESRSATVRLLVSEWQPSIIFRVHRYLREGQTPRKTYQGTASIEGFHYKEVTVSDSLSGYILFVKSDSKSHTLRCSRL